MPTPEHHALLSPSSAARWINCPASVRLTKDIPSATSQYAEAGRVAHAIAELKARKKFVEPMGARTFNSRLKKLKSDPNYAPEMDRYTDTYLDVLTEHAMSYQSKPLTALEVPVPIGIFTGETKPDGSAATGTADCIQIGGNVLWVTDYKNGSGHPVSAEDNPQMKLYALGALYSYSIFYADVIKTVKMTIVQPALNSVADWKTTPEELEVWARDVVKPAAESARTGGCEPNPGGWCESHFCPLKNTCRARAEKYLALEAFGKALPAGDPAATTPTLSDDEVGDVLTRAKGLASWVKQLEDYALQACLAGKDIPGWKAVEGRSTRSFADPDTAYETLITNGYPREIIYDQVPKSLSQLEKLLGKKTFADLLGSQVVKPAGRPTLAAASDKRPPYNPAQAAFGTTN